MSWCWRRARCPRCRPRRRSRPCSRAVRELGIAALPWGREARDLQARVEFVRRAGRRFQQLAGRLGRGACRRDRGLARAVARGRHAPRASRAHPAARCAARRLSWRTAARARGAGAHASGRAERLAHTHRLPRRERAGRVGASAGGVRARGDAADRRRRVPVTFKLLSPAQRPVQVTRDLAASGAAPTPRCARTCAAAIRGTTGRRILWKRSLSEACGGEIKPVHSPSIPHRAQARCTRTAGLCRMGRSTDEAKRSEGSSIPNDDEACGSCRRTGAGHRHPFRPGGPGPGAHPHDRSGRDSR